MAIFSYEKIIFRIEEIIFRIEKIIFRIEKIIFQYEKIILGMIKFLKRKYFPDFSYQKIFLSKENIPLPQNHPVLIMHKFFFLPIKSF